MPTELISIVKTYGANAHQSGTLELLDPKDTLDKARTALADVMFPGESFMRGKDLLPSKLEPKVTVEQIVVKNEDGTMKLSIGHADPGLGEDPEDNLQRYQSMLPDQKMNLLRRVEIYRGLTPTSQGFKRSPGKKPAIAQLHAESIPLGTRVVANRTTSEHTFSEISVKLMESSVTSASVELSTPYGGGNASFEYAKSHSTDSKTVKEFLVGNKLFQKVELTFEYDDLVLLPSFNEELMTYIRREEGEPQRAYQLVRALNERGYYVPRKFVLGGALLTSDTTEITEFKQVDTEKLKFEAGVNASYGGISGGAKASHEEEKSEEHSEVNKYNSLSFTQVSGEAVDPESLPDFIASLKPSVNWDVILHEELVPTLALIRDGRMRNYCFRLLNRYGTYDSLVSEQPYLDLIDYATNAQTVFMQHVQKD
jgi:hypothetical protein